VPLSEIVQAFPVPARLPQLKTLPTFRLGRPPIKTGWTEAGAALHVGLFAPLFGQVIQK